MGRSKQLQKPAPAAGAKRAEHPWLTAFIGYAKSECHLSANTVVAYQRDLRRFFKWLEGRNIPNLTIRELADYAAWLHQQKLAPASIARHVVALKIFFRYLQLEGVLKENLVELLGTQRLWQRVPMVMSVQAVEQLFLTPKADEPYWRRDRAMLELLYATGARISEVCGLSLGDLDVEHRAARLYGKGSKERLVPFGRAAAEALAEWLGPRGRPHLVP